MKDVILNPNNKFPLTKLYGKRKHKCQGCRESFFVQLGRCTKAQVTPVFTQTTSKLATEHPNMPQPTPPASTRELITV